MFKKFFLWYAKKYESLLTFLITEGDYDKEQLRCWLRSGMWYGRRSRSCKLMTKRLKRIRLKYEDLTDDDLKKIYLDWRDDMSDAFSGKPYPPEYPRFFGGDQIIFTLNGKNPGFWGLEEYCKQRGVINEQQ